MERPSSPPTIFTADPIDGPVATNDKADGAIQAMVESQLQVCQRIQQVILSTPAEAVEQQREAQELLQTHVGMYRTLVGWLPSELQAHYGVSPSLTLYSQEMRPPSPLLEPARTAAAAALPLPQPACESAAGRAADCHQPPAGINRTGERARRSHARAQSVTLILGALVALFGSAVVGDMSYFPFLCIIGALCLLALAAAAQILSMDHMANAAAGLLLGWPPLRDVSVLLLRKQTEATTPQTVAGVDVAFIATRITFFLLGLVHHMSPKPLRWRLKVLALHALINLLCTANMEYPHIGGTPSVVATSTNEIIPLLAGFTLALLSCGNTGSVRTRDALPRWPRAWARHSYDVVAPGP